MSHRANERSSWLIIVWSKKMSWIQKTEMTDIINTFHTATVVACVALRGFAAEDKQCSMETSVLTRYRCIHLQHTRKNSSVLTVFYHVVTELTSCAIILEQVHLNLAVHWPAAERPWAGGISHTPGRAQKAGLSGWATPVSPRLYWGTARTEAATTPPPPGNPEQPPPRTCRWTFTCLLIKLANEDSL